MQAKSRARAVWLPGSGLTAWRAQLAGRWRFVAALTSHLLFLGRSVCESGYEATGRPASSNFFSPLASMPRYFLAAFPVFIVLGTVLARRRVALVCWLGTSASLGILLTLYFTTWRCVA